jgi:hypothetical protein
MNENTTKKLCTRCKTVLPITEFPKINKTKAKVKDYCRDCEKERHKTYYENNKEKIKAKQLEYRSNNKEKIKAKHIEWIEGNREKMNEYFKAYHKEWLRKHPGKIKEYNRNAHIKKLELALSKLAEEKKDEGPIRKANIQEAIFWSL